ncbi:hypothetical protein IE81DRAFT_345670 [Ceraceosorus guamensis]|uniref:Cation/H+ exchanger transmembrane domain-containing protein n=1 Tax=Ceraceosorus guamensis TaxID=1522189 RepID=A0A316W6Q9_9BASI|nr:hypothetical protein IE81DRAFT_345670 [Ceraceosorus guamensis]PWN44441.1 hypothetical protein IE81DRAFT_345670 [Ceraceosorus guamensis]
MMHEHLVGMLSKRASASVVSGHNPATVDPSNPLQLFIIQAGIIIIFTRILGFFLAKIKQPSVIAEVIGGIVLGPTVMGRIPHFTEHIFPQPSIPYLSLVANIGLLFFLFIIGLEIDVSIVRRNAFSSTAISMSGLILPFGLGAALSYGIYKDFINQERVSYGHFLLFAGTAFSITALPVLARILGSLNMVQTRVGTIVLAAGVGNDVIGWVLLALTVALVNAQTGVTAVYILLAVVGWALVLFFLIKPAFIWLARRTGSLEKGPSQLMLTVTILLVFASGFVTDILGVHAIFGAFLVGLIIPHEGGFAVALTEKIEDLVLTTMLPLYFTLSGLRTQLGTLDGGLVWGYTIAIILVAFSSKFLGCATAAKLCGFTWRETGAIGSLMSCKGLVELVVLNIGLQAGILDTRTFSMFVVMALVTTFVTTPLTQLIYPAKYYEEEVDAIRAGSDSKLVDDSSDPSAGRRSALTGAARRLLVVLDGFEHLPGLLTLMQLMRPSIAPRVDPTSTTGLRQRHSQGPSGAETEDDISEKESASSTQQHRSSNPKAAVGVSALRLIELTDRTSAVMRVAEAESTLRADPIINVFRTFGQLNNLPVDSSMAVVNADEYANTVIARAQRAQTNFLVVPWTVPEGSSAAPVTAALQEQATSAGGFRSISNPFETIFGNASGADGVSRSPENIAFVRRVFQTAPCDVGLLVDKSTPAAPGFLAGQQHVLVGFMGGPDDRSALSLVHALCESNLSLRVTVLRFRRIGADEAGEAPIPSMPPTVHHAQHARAPTTGAGAHVQDTMYPTMQGTSSIEATLEDDIAVKKVEDASSSGALSGRLVVKTISTSRPLRDFIRAVDEVQPTLIVCGRGRRMPTMTHRDELRFLIRNGLVDPQAAENLNDDSASTKENASTERALSSETCKTIGEPAMAITRFATTGASCLVVAASMRARHIAQA